LSEIIKIGTCAWSFDDWRGAFYPPQLPHSRWLEFYARHFSAVEVDSTFYHTPGAHAVAHWLDQTPDAFCFVCKAPREVTHEAKLRDCREKMEAFLEGIAPLRAKLGCVLIQLPPGFSPRHDETALRDFIFHLPLDFRYAVEFRHADWHLPRIVHLFEQHRICWVWNDTTPLDAQNRAAFEFLPQTTDFLYVRLMGDLGTKYHGDGSRARRYRGLSSPRDTSLESWAAKIQRHIAESSRVFIFANNHFEGFSPLTCQRLAAHLGIRIELPRTAELAGETESDRQLDLL
jgi:uncharacterized protein YecE (DUF72 family)